jgi:hypothetical protein
MMLMTKELARRVPALGSTAEDPDPIVQCKFFYPDFGWTWYLIEWDGVDICYGFVDGDFPELGNFSLAELQATRGKLGLSIERDRSFDPCRLSELRARLGR